MKSRCLIVNVMVIWLINCFIIYTCYCKLILKTITSMFYFMILKLNKIQSSLIFKLSIFLLIDWFPITVIMSNNYCKNRQVHTCILILLFIQISAKRYWLSQELIFYTYYIDPVFYCNSQKMRFSKISICPQSFRYNLNLNENLRKISMSLCRARIGVFLMENGYFVISL